MSWTQFLQRRHVSGRSFNAHNAIALTSNATQSAGQSASHQASQRTCRPDLLARPTYVPPTNKRSRRQWYVTDRTDWCPLYTTPHGTALKYVLLARCTTHRFSNFRGSEVSPKFRIDFRQSPCFELRQFTAIHAVFLVSFLTQQFKQLFKIW